MDGVSSFYLVSEKIPKLKVFRTDDFVLRLLGSSGKEKTLTKKFIKKKKKRLPKTGKGLIVEC